MKKEYDVIVIGAGNGGLTAAANCAKAGFSTLLLERHNLPGGSASSFVRGRFEFETALHELCNIGNPEKEDSLDYMFRQLGAEIDWVNEDTTFRLVVPAKEGDPDAFLNEDGVWVTVDARMPSGFEAFSRKLDELVPGSYESAIKAFRLSAKMYDALDKLGGLEKGEFGGLPQLAAAVPDFMRMTSHTLNEGLDAIGMPKKAQDIFSTYWSYMGVPGGKFDLLYYLTVLHSYVDEGAGMPRLRSHELSLALDKAIRDFGGEIWYHSEVTEVIMRNGKPAGVVVNGNKKVWGKRFICNAAPGTVWSEMLQPQYVPEKQLRMENARTTAAALTTVYLGMNKTKDELGFKDYSIFIAPFAESDKQYQAVVEKGFSSGYCIINCLNHVIPDCTPPGTCQLFLTTMTFGDVMAGVKPEDYKKLKTKVAKEMIETCERALNIEITPYIEEIEIALPPTFSRYLNTPQGTPYGYMLNLWDSLIPRTVQFAQDQPFENFIFCGASQERGDGYGCAYYTGEKAAKLTVAALRKEEN